MGSIGEVFVLLAAACLSSTVAVAPCSDDIIAGLKIYPECYRDGLVPHQEASEGQGTFLVVPTLMFPEDVYCVTAVQGLTEANATLHLKNGETTHLTFKHHFAGEDIEETDAEGLMYRIYVIRNEHSVYVYYRCLVDNNVAGADPQHSVYIAIGCNAINDEESAKVVATAKKCFQKLNITDYIDMEPCDC